MASVYTTHRGKNKKNKAKDQSKNSAQCKVNKFDGDLAADKAKVLEDSLGEVQPKFAVSGLTSTAFRLRQEHEQRLRDRSLLICSSPSCPHAAPEAGGASEGEPAAGGGGSGGGGSSEPPKLTLQRCTCHLASYCSPACQRSDWDQHKAICKAKRAENLAIAEAIERAKEKAELEAKAASEALLEELEREEAAAAAAGKGGGGK